jgi:hypothetical protein
MCLRFKEALAYINAALDSKSGEDINALLETLCDVMLCMAGLTSNHGCDAVQPRRWAGIAVQHDATC